MLEGMYANKGFNRFKTVGCTNQFKIYRIGDSSDHAIESWDKSTASIGGGTYGRCDAVALSPLNVTRQTDASRIDGRQAATNGKL